MIAPVMAPLQPLIEKPTRRPARTEQTMEQPQVPREVLKMILGIHSDRGTSFRRMYPGGTGVSGGGGCEGVWGVGSWSLIPSTLRRQASN